MGSKGELGGEDKQYSDYTKLAQQNAKGRIQRRDAEDAEKSGKRKAKSGPALADKSAKSLFY
jgi:hypothetical protein